MPDPRRADEIFPLVYQELRALAADRMAREAPGHTLDATALSHDAYLRLSGGRFGDRQHFLAAAATAMRRVLVDSARRKGAAKRDNRPNRAALDPDLLSGPIADRDCWLDLDEALSAFARVDAAAAGLASLRLFAGLSVEEAAGVTGVSRATAFRQWTYARVWLSPALAGRRTP